ncbi:hypothetical protein [Stenoxybacter acetivorans]|uniref:hypothetical protein n=1 Tax=Stenoxybacter acetivorans TaxID=422441 RepID=UPI000569BBFC|nr:hypothetical protein [Stenoxybacter acetivorans]
MPTTSLFQTEPIAVCAEVLDFWLNECSADDAPTAETVAQWCDIFTRRGGAFMRLAAECEHYLAESGA